MSGAEFPSLCNLEAAVAASENPCFLDAVSDVYRQAYGARGLEVCEILPVPKALQADAVDYHVTLANSHTGDGFQSWCELKTEKHCFGRISIETWSVYEAGIPGWQWKLTNINEQRLCTIWRDGLVYFPYMDDYKNWLWDNRERLEAKVGKHPDYRPFKADNFSVVHGKYTSYGFTVPITELRDAFGTKPWYRLEGDILKLVQDGIDALSKANKGGAP